MDGTPFGRYRLIELLGRGGMGEVWRAYDTVTDRVVAIKVLPANLSEDEEFQHRFRREAHAAARLDTPHVVPIYDYGEIDGRLFVSMRLINGRDLGAVLADGSLDPARTVRIIDQVANALQAAHQVGLLHRDIKPSNILLDRDDFAYLIDFGIARATDETRMTKTGNTIGTFAYIAPERLDPRAGEDARADIYSLACVLYEALTGVAPFAGTTTAQLITAHLNTPPPRPSTTQPTVPAAFDPVIAKGMAKDPDQRYPTTVELANAAHDAITTPLAPASEPTLLAHPTPPQPAPWPQQPAEPTQHAPEQVGQPPAGPPPWQPAPPGNRNQWLVLGIVAALVVAAALTGAGIYFATKKSNKPAATSSITTPASTTPPVGPPPVAEAALTGLLLSPAEINATMGATGMTVYQPWNTMEDVGVNPANPPECLPIDGPAEDGVYAGKGSTAVRGQQLRDPQPYKHVVQQWVVLFPSAQAAAAFAGASPQSWSACANRSYTSSSKHQWSAGPVSNDNGTVSATTTEQSGTGWACQRALMARNNVVIDVSACSNNTTDQAIGIAGQIAVKVTT